MNQIPERYDRSMRLFGADGQRAIGNVAVVIVGGGGVGSALAQHLALLGVRRIATVDPEELDETNRNRFIGARTTDAVPGTLKVALIDRLIRETNSDVESIPIAKSLLSVEAFDAIKASDWVFGCFDDDGPRAVLNELCAAYGLPYIDLAADVPADGIYGGRVCVAIDGDGCLECLGLLDRRDVRRYFESKEQRDREDAVYGVARQALGQRGPSVSPINGVIAGLAATEFMVAVTDLRRPTRLQEYRGWESKVVVNTDSPRSDCLYCKGIRGAGATPDVERYLRLVTTALRR
jgi:molybdopterin/thiamine biosynthesis adenylyltransferase